LTARRKLEAKTAAKQTANNGQRAAKQRGNNAMNRLRGEGGAVLNGTAICGYRQIKVLERHASTRALRKRPENEGKTTEQV
jgi:hypothetical protein